MAGRAAAAAATGDGRQACHAICQRGPPGARPPVQGLRCNVGRGPGRVGLAPASARPPRFSKCVPPFCFRFPPPHVTRSARPHTHPFSPRPARPRRTRSPPSTASLCRPGLVWGLWLLVLLWRRASALCGGWMSCSLSLGPTSVALDDN